MNPIKAMAEKMMMNNPMMNNPTIRNAVNMGNNGDFAGVEKIARNLCEQRGIDADQAIKNLIGSLGMR